jgi:DNA-binding winged helix-turn-helix (wHTH) protein/TolB-like protein/Flp pilus assembly protein TadD
MDQVVAAGPDAYVFPPFRLDLGRRQLDRDGAPVSLSSRAFDLLLALIEARDRVLSRADIMATVWAGVVVEDHNLSVQMHSLRRALGDTGPEPRFIATVPGRGYRFVGQVERDPAPPPVPSAGPTFPGGVWLAVLRRRRAIAFGAGAGALAVMAVAMLARPGDGPPLLSLAVMPFRNLSDDGARPYLADAVSTDLSNDLAHLPGSVVIDSESAAIYKGKPVAAAAIGRALNVRYLVRGSLRAEGPSLHITAELVDTESGKQPWSDQFDTVLTQMADIRTTIVRRIASSLGVKLVQLESLRAAAKPPGHADALDLFLQARATMATHDSMDGLTLAQHLLEGALAKDPAYDDALGALGLLLVRKVEGFDDPQEDADFREAKAVTQKALERDPRNESALVAQGRLLSEAGRNADAQAAFETVLQGNPNNVAALFGVAFNAWRQGRLGAVSAPLQKALLVDPAGPSRPQWLTMLGAVDVLTGHPQEAEPLLAQALAGEAGTPQEDGNLGRSEYCHLFLIAAAAGRGDAQRARIQYTEYARHWRYRSAWRIEGYFTRQQRDMAGFSAFIDALVSAGMPKFLNEHTDFGVAAKTQPVESGDFDPTPTAWPGGQTIDTQALRALLAGPGAVVLDAGRGLAAPAGAIVPARIDPDGDPIDVATHSGLLPAPGTLQHPVVVMGDGVTGWQSYNLALGLMKRFYSHVLWYRGGEESWAHDALEREHGQYGRNDIEPTR